MLHSTHTATTKIIIPRKPEDYYLDGGTAIFCVVNKEETGLDEIYQDFRMDSKTKSQFFTKYPSSEGAKIIVKEDIEWETLNHRDKEDVHEMVDREGFDYAMVHKSSWKEIKDPKFHELLDAFKEARKELVEYIDVSV